MNAAHPSWQARWHRFSAATVRAYRGYANWLVGISWRRFIALSFLLLVVMGIVHDLPPFTWTVTEQVPVTARARARATPPVPPAPPAVRVDPSTGKGAERGAGMQIDIDGNGIRIGPKVTQAARAASAAASAAALATQAAASAASATADRGVHIQLPPGPVSDAVREAVAQAQREINDAVREARQDAEDAARDAAEARAEAARALDELATQAASDELSSGADGQPRTVTRKRRVGIGGALMQLTLLWIIGSAILKFTYKGRMQAEVKAAQATETAEAESLKRQVVEARMAAMQAQVEPHFLFNTLASIDHLIETDPARASQMQKNLIALLRASMPTMREAGGSGGNGGVRELGRELAVIRPYLEILKVRMEERLATEIDVPEGLLSAEFPPMMMQTLVENAIKHGLEPKAEGGTLRVKAEIVHGKLQVTVADTGLGFGKAATAGTGVGLANIRERLQLLYGPKAALTVTGNVPSGTVVTITVPYRMAEATAAAAAAAAASA